MTRDQILNSLSTLDLADLTAVYMQSSFEIVYYFRWLIAVMIVVFLGLILLDLGKNK